MGVTIKNFDKDDNTAYGALHHQYINNQANADKWMETALIADKAWQEQRKAEMEKYWENESFWRKVQMGIALLQQVAALYFANKQYKAAKEAQDHQIEVWKTEKEWAKRYQDLWYNKYRPIEESFLSEKSNQPEYQPRYDEVEARAVTDVRREFAMAREKMRRCIDPRCIGMRCATEKQLAIAEARAAVGAINKGYRAEEARKDVKDAQRDEAIFSLLQLGRGLQTTSLNALNSASAAAKIAATYKPYAGYQAAVGMIGSYWQSYAADQAGINRQRASIMGRQGANYAIGQGYTGNTVQNTRFGGDSYSQVTGTVGGGRYYNYNYN